MKLFGLCSALLLLFIVPISTSAAQDPNAKYKYVVQGRVVDNQGKPVPKASLIMEPKGGSGGCVIDQYAADEEGRFRIEKESSNPIENWVIYATTQWPEKVEVPISPPHGLGPAAGQEIKLTPSVTDLGDVPVQIRYGLIRLRLPEASRDSLYIGDGPMVRLGTKIIDMNGDVISVSSAPGVAVDRDHLTLSLALPEGSWHVRVSVGELDGLYAPDKPVVITYGQSVMEYTLVPVDDNSHPSLPDIANIDSPEAARQALEKLGIPYTEEAFIERIQRDNLHLVRLFLQAGMNPNVKNKDGEAALMIAIERGSTSIVEALLDNGADANTAFADGVTALAWAVCRSELDMARLLLNKGARVNARDQVGRTPLMFPPNFDGAEIVDLLLGAGADINARDNDGIPALMLAISLGFDDVALALIQRGVDVQAANKHGQTALIAAAYQRGADIIAALVAKGARINAADNKGRTALMYAVSKGNEETIEALEQAGAIDTPNIALLHAAKSGDAAAALSALAKGADPKASYPFDETPLMFAAEEGHTAIVTALLAKGADVNIKSENDGATALMKAAGEGHLDIVRLLVRKGAKLNEHNQQGKTALMYAAGAGHLEAAKYLLDMHADRQREDVNGWTALDYAQSRDQTQVVELFHKRGIKE